METNHKLTSQNTIQTKLKLIHTINSFYIQINIQMTKNLVKIVSN